MASFNIDARRAAVPRQRLSEFMAFSKGNNNSPATNNRYSVSIATPNILKAGRYFLTPKFQLETGDLSKVINMYANTVNLPSKQVTTGSITNIGSAYNYATSSTVSQINISFTMPRSHNIRLAFERWISIMASDANQFVDYYDDYVSPNLYIYKWERGGGSEFAIPEYYKELLKSWGIDEEDIIKYKDDQLVGAYDLRNVFPINIGAMTLTNDQAGLLQMDVTFSYERYRFYAQPKFDEDGFSYRYGQTASTENLAKSPSTISPSQQNAAAAPGVFDNAQFSTDKTGLQGPSRPF